MKIRATVLDLVATDFRVGASELEIHATDLEIGETDRHVIAPNTGGE
jgi:hypothetical protein